MTNRRPPRAPEAVRVVLASALLLVAARAMGDGLVLRYEPRFGVGEQRSVEQSGAVQQAETTTWDHLVNASFDRSFREYLRLSATTNYERLLSATDSAGQHSELDNQNWTGHVQLTAGRPELNVTPFYSRTDRSSEMLQGTVTTASPRLTTDLYGALASWRPEGLPAVSLSATRADRRAAGGALADTTTTSALLDSSYVIDKTELRYRLQYQNPVDHRGGVDSVSVGQDGRVSYADRYLGNRVSFTGTYLLSDVRLDTRVSGVGGTVQVRQAPVTGLSALEAPPATPTTITLARTPALVDGDRAASVGLDLGFGRTVAGDVTPRELGAQLANSATPVNTIYVWVDRALPAELAATFVWAAYRSEDNLTWTPVALAGSVTFGVFDNRFEIPIAETQARYLKVVTRPLAAGATLEPRYSSVLVTELELLDVVPAAALRGRSARTSGSGSASVRAKLLAEHRLFYDFNLNVTHTNTDTEAAKDSFQTYDVSNGLAYEQPLGRLVTASGRLERTDSHQRSRSDATSRFTAALAAVPLPALSSTATYSATLTQASDAADRVGNSVVWFLQALPYQGIALQGNASFGVISQGGVRTRTQSEVVTAALNPHRTLTLTGTYARDDSKIDASGAPRIATRRSEGGFTFAPIPALFLAASLANIEQAGKPSQRITNVNASVRPFPRGTVYLTASYSEAYDSVSETRTRGWGPYLRWNVTNGNYVEASYAVQQTTTPLLETRLSAFTVKLTLTL